MKYNINLHTQLPEKIFHLPNFASDYSSDIRNRNFGILLIYADLEFAPLVTNGVDITSTQKTEFYLLFAYNKQSEQQNSKNFTRRNDVLY